MLPRGLRPGQREPWWRMALIMLTIVLMAMAVAVAARYLIQPRTTLAQESPTSSASPTPTEVRVAPTPSPVDDTPTAPRTIVASGLATISPDITLPHENAPGWQGANLRIESCSGAQPEEQGLRQASDLRTIQLDGEADLRTESLVVTTDESSATGIYNDFTSAMTRCSAREGAEAPQTASRAVRPVSSADSGRLTEWTRASMLAVNFPVPGADPSPEYLLIAQSGRALAIATVAGDRVPPIRDGDLDQGVAASLQSFADALAPELCRYKESGCEMPPVVFPPGSALLPDGRVLLPDGVVVETSGRAVDPDGNPLPQVPFPPGLETVPTDQPQQVLTQPAITQPSG